MSDENCIFCKIAQKKIDAALVYESGDFVAIRDIHPQAPVHYLLIPKRHIENAAALTDADLELAGKLILEAAEVARSQNLQLKGYRLVLNCNGDGGETVSHLHMHILGGRQMKWPPG